MMRCVSAVVWVMWQAICGVGNPLGQQRERHRIIIGFLPFELIPGDGAAIEPRRRSGLEPPERKARFGNLLGKPMRWRLVEAPGRNCNVSDMNEPAQKRAGGQH